MTWTEFDRDQKMRLQGNLFFLYFGTGRGKLGRWRDPALVQVGPLDVVPRRTVASTEDCTAFPSGLLGVACLPFLPYSYGLYS